MLCDYLSILKPNVSWAEHKHVLPALEESDNDQPADQSGNKYKQWGLWAISI